MIIGRRNSELCLNTTEFEKEYLIDNCDKEEDLSSNNSNNYKNETLLFNFVETAEFKLFE